MELLTTQGIKKFEYQKSKMVDGHHFEKRQNAKSLQPLD